jgi:hypothetical protein
MGRVDIDTGGEVKKIEGKKRWEVGDEGDK